MNKTHAEHAVTALIIQFSLAVPLEIAGISWAWWFGAAAGAAFFVGYEIAQRAWEIARDTHRGLLDLAWWEGLTGWNLDRKLDVAVPWAACLVAPVARMVAHG